MQTKIEISEIKVYKMDNGFTVKVEYRATEENGYRGTYFKNFVANNLTEVMGFIKEWCEKEGANND